MINLTESYNAGVSMRKPKLQFFKDCPSETIGTIIGIGAAEQ